MSKIPIHCWGCRQEHHEVQVGPELFAFTVDEHGQEWWTCPFGHRVITKEAYLQLADQFGEEQ